MTIKWRLFFAGFRGDGFYRTATLNLTPGSDGFYRTTGPKATASTANAGPE